MENIIFSKFLTNEWKHENCLKPCSPCKVKTLKSQPTHKFKVKKEKFKNARKTITQDEL